MEEKNEYTLSFQEAIQKCLNKEGFLIGENFAKGYYVTVMDEVLILKFIPENKTFHENRGFFYISHGTVSQKYKLIVVANEKTVGY